MGRAPTLQSLAVRARDSFAEDGYPFEDSIPSSLDVVAATYSETAGSGEVTACASTTLRRHMENRGCIVAQATIDAFVRAALTYLRAVYPSADALKNADERRLLSHLFWGNLVEARHAMGALDRKPPHALGADTTPAPVSTVTCSCGAALTSDDDEALWSFTRAHAAQQHSAPPQPLRPAVTPAAPGVATPGAIVQWWQEELADGRDLYEFFLIRDEEVLEHRGSVEESNLLRQLGLVLEQRRA